MTRGRPLRFLALILAGWTAVRVALLWPAVTKTPPLTPVSGQAAAHQHRAGRATPPTAVPGIAGSSRPPGIVDVVIFVRGVDTSRRAPATVPLPVATRSDVPQPDVDGPAIALAAAPAGQPSPVLATVSSAVGVQPFAAAPRLHGDTWLIARPSGGDDLAFGQLGASQAGVRLTYAIDTGHRLALSARASAPLRGVGRESAMGLDWQPTRLPIHLLIEERLPLDGGGARPAGQLIAGIARRLPFGLAAEGYAQAGAVHRRGGFADGSVRIARPLLTRRAAQLEVGVGAWGAVQRRVTRLDVGPTLGLALPARGGVVRVAVDYRLRVAGRARPGSGPALSLGSSF